MLTYLIKTTRPRFWLYLAGPFLLGIGFSLGRDSLAWTSDFFLWYGLLYFLIPANAFLYGVNDLFDKETDKENTKKAHKEVWVSSNKRRNAVWAMVTISFLLSLPLFIHGNTLVQSLLGSFFALAYFYSAPPIRFKARFLLDSASNVLYIVPGLISYSYFVGTLPPMDVVIAGASWSAAMHLYSAIPDIKPDKKAELTTSAVILGERISLLACTLLWGLTSYIALSYSLLLLPVLVYPFIPLTLALTHSHSKNISRIYWYFPVLNALLGFSLFLFSYLL